MTKISARQSIYPALVAAAVTASPSLGITDRLPTRSLSVDDLWSLEEVVDVEVSPDGESIVYAVASQGSDGRPFVHTSLWRLDVQSRETRQLTKEMSVARPQWTPDGASILFLAAQDDRRGLWSIPARGGEARALLSENDVVSGYSVSDFALSPDGRQVALFGAVTNAGGRQERTDADSAAVKVIVASAQPEHFSQWDRRENHIAIVDLGDGSIVRVNQDELWGAGYGPLLFAPGYRALAWSSDGRFVTALARPAGVVPGNASNKADVYVIEAATGHARKVGGQKLTEASPVFSPDGERVALLSANGTSIYEDSISLMVVPATGDGQTRKLT